jgi:hypothetical protein
MKRAIRRFDAIQPIFKAQARSEASACANAGPKLRCASFMVENADRPDLQF